MASRTKAARSAAQLEQQSSRSGTILTSRHTDLMT
jgi:hypothetical protein